MAFGGFLLLLLLVLVYGQRVSMQRRTSQDYVDNNNDYDYMYGGDYHGDAVDSPYDYQSDAEESLPPLQSNSKYFSGIPRSHVVRQLMPDFEPAFNDAESEPDKTNEENEDEAPMEAPNNPAAPMAAEQSNTTTTTECVEVVNTTCVELPAGSTTTCGPDEIEVPSQGHGAVGGHAFGHAGQQRNETEQPSDGHQETAQSGKHQESSTQESPTQTNSTSQAPEHQSNSNSTHESTSSTTTTQSPPTEHEGKPQDHPAQEPHSQPQTPPQQPAAFNPSGNSDKTKELQIMIQHLYVAQARVQLEASEIKKAQGTANAAQAGLEEASNKVRTITSALQAAQQEVASAAIRAQTAQLLLDAHDQLLFAARQDVDALSAHVVGLQVLEGISPPQVNFDVNGLMERLKQPLSSIEWPTAVPTVVKMPNITKHA